MITNVLAVAAAAVASFLLSSVWYAGVGRALARLNPVYAEPAAGQVWRALLELLRSVVLATVIAVLCDWIGVDGVASAVRFALLAWVGFPFVLFTGSVLHERVPWRLAAIHAGDWLIKLVAVTIVIGLWR
jgi:hypothetical protein